MAYDYAFSAEDLYIDLDDKCLTNNKAKLRTELRYKTRRRHAAAIFEQCFYDILLDAIENNVTFVLPLLYGNYAEIHITTIEDEKFKNLYKSGRFQNVDFVASEFSTSRVEFLYRYKGKTVKIPIILKKDLGRLLIKRIKEGKKYY